MRSTVFLLAAALLAGCGGGSSALPTHTGTSGAARSIFSVNGDQSADGAGTFSQTGELRTFAFSAVKHADGTVDGQATLDSRIADHHFHYVLNCLRIVGNTAYLSGKVTESNFAAVQVGYDAWFAVRTGAPDQITRVLTDAVLANCKSDPGYTLLLGGFNNIEGGSINIHT